MSVERRRMLIEPEHSGLSVVRRCELVSVSRSGFHYQPVGETAEALALMRLIDAPFLETPWHGSRQTARHLRRDGHEVGRKRVRRLMAVIGLVPICQRPRATVSNTTDAEFCIAAPEEALARYGRPEIFNTDQGSHFTSSEFTGVLRAADVRISMDGRGRWMDNVLIERLWRSLKCECIDPHAFETGSELRAGLAKWIGCYNARRPHSTLARRTPDEAYEARVTERLAA